MEYYKVSEEVDKMDGVYDYDARINVQWPFGYGKSYTTFEYSNFKVDKSEFKYTDMLTFTIDVKNVGSREGLEHVLLFSTDDVASIIPDNKRLRAFESVQLKPGEKKCVKITIPASTLAFVNADGRWILEEGQFTMRAGNKTLSITCTATHTWPTPNI